MRGDRPERPDGIDAGFLPELDPSDPLAPAVDWIRERGGCAACALDVLKMTAGNASAKAVQAALAKAKAPAFVRALIGPELYSLVRAGDAERIKLRAQVDEGDADAPYWNRQ